MRRQAVHYYSQYINGQNSMLKRANILKKKIFWNRNYLVFSKSTHRVLSSYKLRVFFFNFVQGFTQDESRLQIAHYYTVHNTNTHRVLNTCTYKILWNSVLGF